MSGVVFIISKSEVGGAQKWAKEQIEMLAISTTDPIYLVTDDCAGWLVDEVKDFCQDVFCDPAFSKGFSINTFYRLLRFSKKHQVKVIVASSAFAGVYARLLKIFIHIKVIYVSHGWSSIYRGKTLGLIYTFIERVLSLFTDVILCISNSDYKAAQNIIKIPEKKLTLIENKLTKAGDKNIYIKIIDENQKTLKSENPINILNTNGEKIEMSSKRTVNYQKETVDLCVFHEIEGVIGPGEYEIEVYNDSYYIGSSSFSLR